MKLSPEPICLVDVSNNDLFGFDEITHNAIHVCKCKQCKASKQKTHRNAKKLVKRMLNKKRRQLTSNPKHFIHMWA